MYIICSYSFPNMNFILLLFYFTSLYATVSFYTLLRLYYSILLLLPLFQRNLWQSYMSSSSVSRLNKNSTALGVGVGVGIAFVVLILAIAAFIYLRRRQARLITETTTRGSSENDPESDSGPGIAEISASFPLPPTSQ